MSLTLGVILIGALTIGLLLYIGCRAYKTLHDRGVPLRNKAQCHSGPGRFCRWFVDSEGNWGRVMTSHPPKREAEISRHAIPDFLRH
jgi:hypothetical protein